MRRCFVTLVWLLTLALPLQGLAVAAPALGFGAMHDRPAAAHEASAAPCHAAASPVSADNANEPDEAAQHAGCSQCAVCHASAAPLPPTTTAPGASQQAEAPPAWQSPSMSAVDPDGLDRPPRRAFA